MSPKSNKAVALEGIRQGSCDFKPTRTEAFQFGSPHSQCKLKNDSPLHGSVHIEDSVNLHPGGMSPEVNRSPAKELGAATALAGGPICSNPKPLKKKKGDEEQKKGSKFSVHHSTTAKKPRLIWTAELHRIFVDAINRITIKEAVPKKILEYMRDNGAPDLTRENVASHLQKYRLYLKRLKTNEELNTSSKLPSKSVPLNVTKESNFKPSSPPNQTNCTQNNNSSSCSCLIVCPNALSLQSLTLHEPLPNQPQPMDVLPSLDHTQTHYSNQNMLQPLFNPFVALQELAIANDNVWDVNGGTVTGFLNPPTTENWPNMIDFRKSQENTIWAMQHPQLQPEPKGQELNEAVDFSLSNYNLQPPSLSNQFSNIDGHGTYPLMGNCGDLRKDVDYSYFGSFDHYHETMGYENLVVDCEKNMYFHPGSCSNAFECGYPFNPTDQIPTSTMENNMFAQDYQTTFYSHANPMEQPYEHLKKGGEGMA